MAIGIENMLKLTKSAGVIGSAAVKIPEGGINADDIVYAIDIVKEIPNLATVKYSELNAERKDIDVEEKARLAEAFKESFNLDNDSLEDLVEEGVDILFAFVKFISRFI